MSAQYKIYTRNSKNHCVHWHTSSDRPAGVDEYPIYEFPNILVCHYEKFVKGQCEQSRGMMDCHDMALDDYLAIMRKNTRELKVVVRESKEEESPEDQKLRLCKFFELLYKIDQLQKREKRYAQENSPSSNDGSNNPSRNNG